MANKSKKPESYTYKYLGDIEVTLPEFFLTVQKGDTITVKDTINNPLFKLVKTNDAE